MLDIGCGTGDYLPGLLEQGLEVWGLDLSPEMVADVQQQIKTAGGMVHVAAGDIERMPYPDGWYDGIVCAGVLEYLSSDTAALSEIFRVLKPGAVAVVTISNRLSIFTSIDGMVYRAVWVGGQVLEALQGSRLSFRKRTS